MFRFFASEKNDNYFDLSKETLKHIKVTRTEKEEFIIIHDEVFYVCTLSGTQALISRTLDESHEFENEVVLAASIINIKRFEWLIQKATELGATTLIPVLSENVSVTLSDDLSKKVARWNTIALNAAEQSFRNKPMKVLEPIKFEEAIALNITNKFIAHEQHSSTPDISFPQDSLFLIGPEGGFSEKEIKLATEADVKVISLGKRILRAETASLFVLSRVN